MRILIETTTNCHDLQLVDQVNCVTIASRAWSVRGEVLVSRAKASTEYLGKLVADGAKNAQDNFSKVYTKTA